MVSVGVRENATLFYHRLQCLRLKVCHITNYNHLRTHKCISWLFVVFHNSFWYFITTGRISKLPPVCKFSSRQPGDAAFYRNSSELLRSLLRFFIFVKLFCVTSLSALASPSVQVCLPLSGTSDAIGSLGCQSSRGHTPFRVSEKEDRRWWCFDLFCSS